jgi:hypothetical protein
LLSRYQAWPVYPAPALAFTEGKITRSATPHPCGYLSCRSFAIYLPSSVLRNPWVKFALLVMALAFVGVQFVPIERNHTTRPPVSDLFEARAAPDEVRTAIEHACYDCHSDHTRYPWYASVQPIGWWLGRHIKQGKADLNFSEFNSYSPKKAARKLEESYDDIDENEMPLRSYRWLHPEARLSPDQKQAVLNWLDALQTEIDPGKDKKN